MQTVFVIIAICGLAYFLLGKRTFDFFSLGFLSTTVYFLPGFYGYVQYTTDYTFTPTDIHDVTYVVMSLVLFSVAVGGWLYTSFHSEKEPTIPAFIQNLNITRLMVTANWLGGIGWCMTFLTLEQYFFVEDKTTTMEHLTRWHDLMAGAATIGFLLAIKSRSLVGLACSAIILVLDLALNIRANMALAIIAAVMAYLAFQKPARLLSSQLRLVLLSMVLVMFFFGWQQLMGFFQAKEWDALATAVTSTETYAAALDHSEPFVTQSILNEVLDARYTVPIDHFVSSLCALIPFYNEIFGMPMGFCNRFEPVLFPGMIKYGNANNIWAEALAGGGWPLLGVYIVGYIATIWTGSRLVRSSNAIVSSLSAIFFAYFAFYIHRNDLMFQIVLQKRLLMLYASCAILSQLFAPDRKQTTKHGIPVEDTAKVCS